MVDICLFILGMTEENIKEIGRMANNMVTENFSTLRMEFGKREFGVMEEESNGKISMQLHNNINIYE